MVIQVGSRCVQAERYNTSQVMDAFFAHRPDSNVTEWLEVTVWLDGSASDQGLRNPTPSTHRLYIKWEARNHLMINWSCASHAWADSLTNWTRPPS